MFLSRNSLFAGAALFALTLLSATSATAQQPRGYYTYRYGYNPGYYGSARPVAPPSPKGGAAHAPLTYVVSQPRAEVNQPTPQAAETSGLNVAVRWAAPAVTYVGIRGPDGKVRYFALKNGPETIQVRRVTLQPGERLVLNLAGSGPAKSGH